MEDLSLVPTLKGPFLERERKGVGGGASKDARGALAAVSPNLPAADAFGDDADANDAPDPARVVDAHGFGAARPRWDADRHLEKLRRPKTRACDARDENVFVSERRTAR